GVVFGAISTAIFHQLDELDTKHHFLYVIFTFIIGVAGFGVIITKANQLAATSGGYQHGFLSAATYLLSFFIPYATWRVVR
ncbi:MAG: hypothetical protein ABEI52_03830, partial [Halobacteriaceae archaeon]